MTDLQVEFIHNTVCPLLQVCPQTCVLSAFSVGQQDENCSCGCNSPKELQAEPRPEWGQVIPHPFTLVRQQQEKHMAQQTLSHTARSKLSLLLLPHVESSMCNKCQEPLYRPNFFIFFLKILPLAQAAKTWRTQTKAFALWHTSTQRLTFFFRLQRNKFPCYSIPKNSSIIRCEMPLAFYWHHWSRSHNKRRRPQLGSFPHCTLQTNPEVILQIMLTAHGARLRSSGYCHDAPSMVLPGTAGQHGQ